MKTTFLLILAFILGWMLSPNSSQIDLPFEDENFYIQSKLDSAYHAGYWDASELFTINQEETQDDQENN